MTMGGTEYPTESLRGCQHHSDSTFGAPVAKAMLFASFEPFQQLPWGCLELAEARTISQRIV